MKIAFLFLVGLSLILAPYILWDSIGTRLDCLDEAIADFNHVVIMLNSYKDNEFTVRWSFVPNMHILNDTNKILDAMLVVASPFGEKQWPKEKIAQNCCEICSKFNISSIWISFSLRKNEWKASFNENRQYFTGFIKEIQKCTSKKIIIAANREEWIFVFGTDYREMSIFPLAHKKQWTYPFGNWTKPLYVKEPLTESVCKVSLEKYNAYIPSSH